MHKKFLYLFVLFMGCLYAETMETVPYVDLNRYMGTWYEIASIPQWFQKGCVGSMATYFKDKKGNIKVINKCKMNTLDGDDYSVSGRVRIANSKTNSKLQVNFFLFFWGDYWIVDLDPNYQYVVVTAPSKNTLWILSRHPTLDPKIYEGILEKLKKWDFDTSQIVKSIQPQK